MAKTTNYALDKAKWGHQDLDDDIDRIAANLDIIDTEIKKREDEKDTIGALLLDE